MLTPLKVRYHALPNYTISPKQSPLVYINLNTLLLLQYIKKDNSPVNKCKNKSSASIQKSTNAMEQLFLFANQDQNNNKYTNFLTGHILYIYFYIIYPVYYINIINKYIIYLLSKSFKLFHNRNFFILIFLEKKVNKSK